MFIKNLTQDLSTEGFLAQVISIFIIISWHSDNEPAVSILIGVALWKLSAYKVAVENTSF